MQNQLGADAAVSLLQDCFNPVICASPGGRRTKYITKKSAFLKWNPTNCYSTFDVRIKPSSSTTWTTVTGLTANTYQLTGLLANTSYDWSVRAVCDAASGNFSPWGTKQTFTTLLVNPSNISFLREAETNINIVPNPGNGNFDLQISSAISGSASVTLNDMQGREIIKQQISVNEGQNSASFNVK
ncbi:MAG: fibronectin type III domain-containing protein [Bacteroidetes bacterium]|nr:fibronectin type III domain-containing protein [Bacteroidota bacterium]